MLDLVRELYGRREGLTAWVVGEFDAGLLQELGWMLAWA